MWPFQNTKKYVLLWLCYLLLPNKPLLNVVSENQDNGLSYVILLLTCLETTQGLPSSVSSTGVDDLDGLKFLVVGARFLWVYFRSSPRVFVSSSRTDRSLYCGLKPAFQEDKGGHFKTSWGLGCRTHMLSLIHNIDQSKFETKEWGNRLTFDRRHCKILWPRSSVYDNHAEKTQTRYN